MDAVGAGEFVPDLDPVDGAEQNPAESISNDVKEFSGLEKKTMFTAVNATQQIEDGTIEGEITDFGESVPGGELPATEYRHSDGSAGGDKESNQDGEGNLSEDGHVEMRRTVTVHPLKLRLFVDNREKQTYRLSFIPDKSAQDAWIEISAAGEQSNTKLEIQSAGTITGHDFPYRENCIYIGDIESKKKYSLVYSISYRENCSMGVDLHGYQI